MLKEIDQGQSSKQINCQIDFLLHKLRMVFPRYLKGCAFHQSNNLSDNLISLKRVSLSVGLLM